MSKALGSTSVLDRLYNLSRPCSEERVCYVASSEVSSGGFGHDQLDRLVFGLRKVSLLTMDLAKVG